MLRVTLHRLVPAGLFLIVALAVGPENVFAQCGQCITGQYRYCDGDCPPEHTDQGECTTRYDATCSPEKWCCCSNSYVPGNAGGETTPGGPPTSIGECPTPSGGGGKDDSKEPSWWAASAAVAKTPDPTFTDNVLRLVRDNVLRKSARGKGYIDAVYKHSGDVERILTANPALVKETTARLNENLTLLLKLANDREITVEKKKVDQALALLRKYSNAAGKNAGLKKAIDDAASGLRDRKFLMELGIRVTE
jgi:hypothetical protein